MTPATTWWGKWAAMKTLERHTHTWTPQNSVHRIPLRYLSKDTFEQTLLWKEMIGLDQSGPTQDKKANIFKAISHHHRDSWLIVRADIKTTHVQAPSLVL